MIWLSLVQWSIAAEPASDTEARRAEMQRLRDQLRQYQESGAVEYSDKVYRQMIAFDTDREYITDNDHLMGAMASSTRGDIQTTLDRLELCQSTERAVQWRSFLWESTGPVQLKKNADAELVFLLGMLTPEQLAAVEFANLQLQAEGHFRGRLPNGAYQFGDSHFVVSATGMIAPSTASKKSKSSTKSPKNRKNRREGSNSGSNEMQYGLGFTLNQAFLGEGVRPDTGDPIEATNLVGFTFSGDISMARGNSFIALSPALNLQGGSAVSMWSFQPTISAGTYFSDLSLEGRTFLRIGYLTILESGYVKQTVGGGVGIGAGYDIMDEMSLRAAVDFGQLGSHRLLETNVGIQYTF